MKKKRKTNFKISNMISYIYLILSTLFIVYIGSKELLPIKYFVLLIIAIIAIVLFFIFLLNRRNIFISFIGLILILLSFYGMYKGYDYLKSSYDFLEDIETSSKIQVDSYYLVTLKSKNYENVSKVDFTKVYTFFDYTEIVNIITNISKENKFQYIKVDEVHKLANKLLSKTYGGILVSKNQYEILCEDNKDFKDQAKILKKVDIENYNEDFSNENSKFSVENEVFNVLLTGIDTKGNISTTSRSDANILATINLKTNEVLLTSVPRDYYVKLGTKDKMDKLTHSGIYGPLETLTTIEKLLDTEINYFIRVNFTSLINIVDTIGGITIDSDYTFTAKSGEKFVKGKNKINGKQALAFSRERKAFNDGDNQRVKNQQIVIKGILDKVLNAKTILNDYTKILKSLESHIQTNFTSKEISSLINNQIKKLKTINIESFALKGKIDKKPTYSMGSTKLSVMIPDEESVIECKELIKETLN